MLSFFDLPARANRYEIVYLGFGRADKGMAIDNRFLTWGNAQAVVGERIDNRLIQALFRKVDDRHFEPPIDVNSDGTPIETTFSPPLKWWRI